MQAMIAKAGAGNQVAQLDGDGDLRAELLDLALREVVFRGGLLVARPVSQGAVADEGDGVAGALGVEADLAGGVLLFAQLDLALRLCRGGGGEGEGKQGGGGGQESFAKHERRYTGGGVRPRTPGAPRGMVAPVRRLATMRAKCRLIPNRARSAAPPPGASQFPVCTPSPYACSQGWPATGVPAKPRRGRKSARSASGSTSRTGAWRRRCANGNGATPAGGSSPASTATAAIPRSC